MIASRRAANRFELKLTGQSILIPRNLLEWMTGGPLARPDSPLWRQAGMSLTDVKERLMRSRFAFPVDQPTAVHTVQLTEAELTAVVAVIRASAGSDITAFPLGDAVPIIGVEPEEVADLQRDVARLSR